MVDIRDFIALLKHSRGEYAGKPFVLFPWQAEYLDTLFNTIRDDGMRQFRTSLLAIGRKNGKTQLCAAIGLYMLFCDEVGAEVIVAAGDRQQAALLHDAAKQMIEGSPGLMGQCKVYRNSIVVASTNSVMKTISSESATKHGYGPSCVLVDEYHVQRDRDLVDVLQTATGHRRQPLTIFITTAGFERESPCRKTWEYAERVRDGIIDDPTFYPCIYSAPPDADPFLEETWRLANPNYGVTIKPDYYQKMVIEMKESAATELIVRRLHLNQWTTSETRWLKHGAWDACGTPLRPTAGRPCWCGVDLASTFDTTAFVAVWPDTDGTFDVQATLFMPAENALKRSRTDHVPYEEWAKPDSSGVANVILTDGDITDYDAVRDFILSFCERNIVRGIAIDRWNAVHLTTQLVSEGITVCPFGQGFGSLSSPSKLFEAAVLSGRIRHGGKNKALAWQVSNTQIKTDDAGNIKPTKKHSHATGRIDAVVATIMAIGISSSEQHGLQQEPEIMVM